MSYKNYSCIIFIFLIGLTGCTAGTKNYQYFVQHPQAINDTLNDCKSNNNSTNQDVCNAALRAQTDIHQRLMEFMQNPAQFGQNIIRAEMQIADLKLQIQQLQQNNDANRAALMKAQSEISVLETNIQISYAVLQSIGV